MQDQIEQMIRERPGAGEQKIRPVCGAQQGPHAADPETGGHPGGIWIRERKVEIVEYEIASECRSENRERKRQGAAK
jgi:hypothetical protein